jgi:uncharacterized protein (DUF2147 family)
MRQWPFSGLWRCPDVPALPTLSASAAAFTALLASASAPTQVEPYGSIWTNPQRSVQVHAHRCGQALCGTIVWADDKAKADARKGGTDPLIGTQLFLGFVPDGKSVWRGKVFVPDMRSTFSGTITMVDAQTLRAQGCLLGRVLCRSQVWTRVGAAPS